VLVRAFPVVTLVLRPGVSGVPVAIRCSRLAAIHCAKSYAAFCGGGWDPARAFDLRAFAQELRQSTHYWACYWGATLKYVGLWQVPGTALARRLEWFAAAALPGVYVYLG